jgi:lysozyme family protein
MADFKKAIIVLLNNEGDFSNDPNDPGGATKFGVSLRFLKTIGEFGDFDDDGNIDVDDIKLLTIGRTSFIYQKYWWNNFRYGLINDDDIASKILDWSINIGHVRTHKLVQRAINLMPVHREGETKEYLKVDGIMGNKTIAAINSKPPKDLMMVLRGVLSCYYIGLAEKYPHFEKYIVGWLNKKVNDEKFPID